MRFLRRRIWTALNCVWATVWAESLFTYTGDVAAVKSGTDAGKEIVQSKGLMVNFEVIPSPSPVLIQSLM